MNAAWYTDFGPADEVLRSGKLPKPDPGPGEVRVRIAASGINPVDVKRRLGGRGAAVTDRVVPGVVSLPHGWGHGAPGAAMSVAADHAGVNANTLTDHTAIDPLSGNAVLNGVPVEVSPA